LTVIWPFVIPRTPEQADTDENDRERPGDTRFQPPLIDGG
jgi:hypothetical protein